MAVEQIRTTEQMFTGICLLHKTWKPVSWGEMAGEGGTQRQYFQLLRLVINHPNPMRLPMGSWLLVVSLLPLKVFHLRRPL